MLRRNETSFPASEFKVICLVMSRSYECRQTSGWADMTFYIPSPGNKFFCLARAE